MHTFHRASVRALLIAASALSVSAACAADDFTVFRAGTDYFPGFLPYFVPYLSADGSTIVTLTSLQPGGPAGYFIWSDGEFTSIPGLDSTITGWDQLAGISADGSA